MIVLARNKGYEGHIWQVMSHRKLTCCPECKSEKNLNYIGYAKEYADGFRARLYMCDECNTWTDCIWSVHLDRIVGVPDELSMTPIPAVV